MLAVSAPRRLVQSMRCSYAHENLRIMPTTAIAQCRQGEGEYVWLHEGFNLILFADRMAPIIVTELLFVVFKYSSRIFQSKAQEKQAAITVPVSAENSVRYYGVRGCPRDSVLHSSRTPRRPR